PSVPRRDQRAPQQGCRLAQALPLLGANPVETGAQPGIPLRAAGPHQLPAPVGEGHPHLPAVLGVGGAADEPRLLEAAEHAGHHRRAHVLEVGQRPRGGLLRPVQVREHRELRGGDRMRGGVRAQDPRGDQQQALQLGGELGDLGLRPGIGHSSRPSTAPRRKYATNIRAITYISQWIERALPRTSFSSTYMVKPAPMPTVIEYAKGIRMIVRKAGIAISTSVKSMSVIWVIIRKPTITSAGVAAS